MVLKKKKLLSQPQPRERERERERRPRRKEKEKGRGNVPTYSPGNQKTKNKSNVQERKKRGEG